jgi:hypothetical protein
VHADLIVPALGVPLASLQHGRLCRQLVLIERHRAMPVPVGRHRQGRGYGHDEAAECDDALHGF